MVVNRSFCRPLVADSAATRVAVAVVGRTDECNVEILNGVFSKFRLLLLLLVLGGCGCVCKCIGVTKKSFAENFYAADRK